jgi:hypothetical protein
MLEADRGLNSHVQVFESASIFFFVPCITFVSRSTIGAVRVEDSGGIKARILHGLWNFQMSIILHNPSIITA